MLEKAFDTIHDTKTLFLASQDALEVMGVIRWVSDVSLTLLIWLWWAMIPTEDFTDVTLGCEKKLSSEKKFSRNKS